MHGVLVDPAIITPHHKAPCRHKRHQHAVEFLNVGFPVCITGHARFSQLKHG